MEMKLMCAKNRVAFTKICLKTICLKQNIFSDSLMHTITMAKIF